MSNRALVVDDADWKAAGHDSDPRSRLLTTIVVNGLSLHLEAWAVVTDAQGLQQAAEPMYCDLDGLYLVFEDTRFDTLAIDGREYVLVAVPFEA